jgi:hypothetical protein
MLTLLIVQVQKTAIYSEQDWDRVGLIQNANYPVSTSNADGEETFQISEGGYLRGGGSLLFKYSTQEGNTDILLSLLLYLYLIQVLV